jgi:hypothetical protein
LVVKELSEHERQVEEAEQSGTGAKHRCEREAGRCHGDRNNDDDGRKKF